MICIKSSQLRRHEHVQIRLIQTDNVRLIDRRTPCSNSHATSGCRIVGIRTRGRTIHEDSIMIQKKRHSSRTRAQIKYTYILCVLHSCSSKIDRNNIVKNIVLEEDMTILTVPMLPNKAKDEF